jgi:hypothetical protein
MTQTKGDSVQIKEEVEATVETLLYLRFYEEFYRNYKYYRPITERADCAVAAIMLYAALENWINCFCRHLLFHGATRPERKLYNDWLDKFDRYHDGKENSGLMSKVRTFSGFFSVDANWGKKVRGAVIGMGRVRHLAMHGGSVQYSVYADGRTSSSPLYRDLTQSTLSEARRLFDIIIDQFMSIANEKLSPAKGCEEMFNLSAINWKQFQSDIVGDVLRMKKIQQRVDADYTSTSVVSECERYPSDAGSGD